MAKRKDNEMRLFVVDCESGSLNPKTGAMCSITLKEYNKNNVLDIFIKPSKFKLEYTDQAMKVNGLSKKFLRENGVTEKQAIKMIKHFTNNERVQILGQHTIFDFSFLDEMFKRNGFDINETIHYKLRDTSSTAMFLNDCGITAFESFSLGKMYQVSFGNKIRNAHSSLADTKATERLYKHFVTSIERLKK